MGKGGGGQTTVQKADPWEGVQPYLRKGFEATEDIAQNWTPQYYPGRQVAPFNDLQVQSQHAVQDHVRNMIPAHEQAMGTLTNLMQGGQVLGHQAQPYALASNEFKRDGFVRPEQTFRGVLPQERPAEWTVNQQFPVGSFNVGTRDGNVAWQDVLRQLDQIRGISGI